MLIENQMKDKKGNSYLVPDDIVITTDIAPGDLGYITYMHGKFYGEEYGYSAKFEGYIAQVVSRFLLSYNSSREHLWTARHNGKIIGSIAILDEKDHADLRWFLIDPGYRGFGLGSKLLNLAVDFAREKEYSSIHLVTTGDLTQAIKMYKEVGFQVINEYANDSWHPGLMEIELALDF